MIRTLNVGDPGSIRVVATVDRQRIVCGEFDEELVRELALSYVPPELSFEIVGVKVIFCENEHGNGDVTFPDWKCIESLDFIRSATTAQLRKKAKEFGWGRVNGADYCPGCMESM